MKGGGAGNEGGWRNDEREEGERAGSCTGPSTRQKTQDHADKGPLYACRGV